MKTLVKLLFALAMILPSGCALHHERKDSVMLLGLTPEGKTNLVAATEMKQILNEFLACFPGYDRPVINGVPSELPLS